MLCQRPARWAHPLHSTDWTLCCPLPATTLTPTEVIKSCRFLGRAEMALSDTWLSSLKIWLPLMRCDAGDTVRWALRSALLGCLAWKGCRVCCLLPACAANLRRPWVLLAPILHNH